MGFIFLPRFIRCKHRGSLQATILWSSHEEPQMQATFDWKFNLGNQVEQIEARAFPTSDTIKLQAWTIKSKFSCRKDFHKNKVLKVGL